MKKHITKKVRYGPLHLQGPSWLAEYRDQKGYTWVSSVVAKTWFEARALACIEFNVGPEEVTLRKVEE